MNPYAKVPVLVDDKTVVYESAIINEYLEEKFSEVSLMPADPAERGTARIWIDFCNRHLQAAAHEVRRSQDPEPAKQKIRSHLQTLDRALRDRDYLAGRFSLADITFVPFYTRRERYGAVIDDSVPNVKRWFETQLARPAVQLTL